MTMKDVKLFLSEEPERLFVAVKDVEKSLIFVNGFEYTADAFRYDPDNEMMYISGSDKVLNADGTYTFKTVAILRQAHDPMVRFYRTFIYDNEVMEYDKWVDINNVALGEYFTPAVPNNSVEDFELPTDEFVIGDTTIPVSELENFETEKTENENLE